MIYLFCNDGYGRPFQEVLLKYSKKNRIKACIVFSEKNRGKSVRRGGLSLTLRWLKWLINGIRRLIRKKVRQIFIFTMYGVTVEYVKDVNAPVFYKKIKQGDHGIIAGFNQIFKKRIIHNFSSLVNFHPSLLPYYRGPVPSYWCIYNGEKQTGFTLHVVTEKIDEGEILYQKVIDIGSISDCYELDLKIAQVAVPILGLYLTHVQNNMVWTPVVVDAITIYYKHVEYASFPKE